MNNCAGICWKDTAHKKYCADDCKCSVTASNGKQILSFTDQLCTFYIIAHSMTISESNRKQKKLSLLKKKLQFLIINLKFSFFPQIEVNNENQSHHQSANQHFIMKIFTSIPESSKSVNLFTFVLPHIFFYQLFKIYFRKIGEKKQLSLRLRIVRKKYHFGMYCDKSH